MKIKVNSFGNDIIYDSLEQYAETCLDGDDYNMGISESARQTGRNNSGAIGRLLDALVYKGILGPKEIKEIVQGNVHIDSMEVIND